MLYNPAVEHLQEGDVLTVASVTGMGHTVIPAAFLGLLSCDSFLM